jgi:hypothetical protein
MTINIMPGIKEVPPCMTSHKPVHRPRQRPKRAFDEIEFWKEELKEVLQRLYPRTWREEFWKAELRKIEKERSDES